MVGCDTPLDHRQVANFPLIGLKPVGGYWIWNKWTVWCWPSVTFPAAERHQTLTSTRLYYVLTRIIGCEKLARALWLQVQHPSCCDSMPACFRRYWHRYISADCTVLLFNWLLEVTYVHDVTFADDVQRHSISGNENVCSFSCGWDSDAAWWPHCQNWNDAWLCLRQTIRSWNQARFRKFYFAFGSGYWNKLFFKNKRF